MTACSVPGRCSAWTFETTGALFFALYVIEPITKKDVAIAVMKKIFLVILAFLFIATIPPSDTFLNYK